MYKNIVVVTAMRFNRIIQASSKQIQYVSHLCILPENGTSCTLNDLLPRACFCMKFIQHISK